ncbi:cytochrome c biogenesis protein CcdA [Corallococcus exercitus]|uniref:cytochrome c biogenesis protein CcdA n=1 Tax=Corallococcus exercitus TaxID=2316736 RepID=UPI0035D40FAF
MSLGLPGIFLAGLLTFVSPCVLPLIPLYLSFLAGVSLPQLRGEAGGPVRRPWGVAVAFSLGLSTVFVALGMAASAVGGALAQHRGWVLQLGGLLLFLFGLKQLGVIQVPWLEREGRPWLTRVQRGGNVLSAFLFGGAFALGWTPCIGPVLGGVLTYTAASTSEPMTGALYLGTYALGLSVPLLAAAAAAPLVLRWMDGMKRHLRKAELATGALLAALGLLLLTDSLALLTPTNSPLEPAPVAARAAPAAKFTSRTPERDADLGGSETAACTPGSGGTTACALPEPTFTPTLPAGSAPLARLRRPTMVEFVSQSCPVCQRMKPVVARLRQSCAARGDVDVLLVDVGSAEGRQAAARHGIRGVPTFLFLEAGGREVSRRVGEQSQAVLAQGLAALGAGACAQVAPALPWGTQAWPG